MGGKLFVIYKREELTLPTRRSAKLCAFDLACLHALSANISTLYLAVYLDGNLLDVRTEGAVAYTMRVADATTSAWCLTADLANFGHSKSTPFTLIFGTVKYR